MKFEVAKGIFLDALQKASFAVPNKSTLQILNNFLFKLEGNVLEIIATDLDLGIRLKINVQGQEDGAIVISARKLLEIIRKQDDVNIRVNVEDYLFHVQAGSYSAKLTGFSPSEYPTLPELQEGNRFEMSTSELQFLVEKTAFACSNDVTRVSLNGVYCERKEQNMIMVATDGHRLGHALIAQEGENWDQGVIIPPKTLTYLLKSLPADTNLEIRIDNNNIGFLAEDIQVTSKLIEGPYPKYQNVIPTEFEKEALLDASRALSVVDRIAATANSRTRQVRLEFRNQVLTISASSQEDGDDSREEIAVDYQGEDGFRLGFSATYLMEILKMCPTDRVRLKMNSPVGACIIEPIDQELGFFFLLMPLRLTD